MEDPLFSEFTFTKPSTIVVSHDYGFFSCCSVTLRLIIKHFEDTNTFPLKVDITDSFLEYKQNPTSKSLAEWFQHSRKKPKISVFHIPEFFENDVYDFDPYCFKPFVETFFTPMADLLTVTFSKKSTSNIG